MQRYDPTKDSDKRFEKVETKVAQAVKEDIEKKQDQEESEEPVPADDASVSSESSESLSADDSEEHEEKQEEKHEEKATNETLPSTDMIEESKDVYEQDKLESVFKQSRQVASTNAAGGFSFGFQVPSVPSEQSNSFSFGFNVSDEPKDDEKPSTDDSPTKSDEIDNVARKKRGHETQRVRRVGLTFPESDLDAYEDLFFSLNEGPKILKDMDAMKQDEDSQNLWQKERVQLTADWKRKQKSALSRKVKKPRR